MLIAGSIGVSYLGSQYLSWLDPRPYLSRTLERIEDVRAENTRRREARTEQSTLETIIRTEQTETVREPQATPTSDAQSEQGTRAGEEPSTPTRTAAENEQRSAQTEPSTASDDRETRSLFTATYQTLERTIENTVETPRTIGTREPQSAIRTPEPVEEPASELEGVIGAWQAATISRMTIVEPLVNRIARDFNVTPATIYGIILSESSLYPDALSADGKQGLLQHRPEVFEAIIELSSHRGTPLFDQILTDNVWDPEMSLRAYHIELRAHREYINLHDPVDIHVVRGADEKVRDVEAYLRTPEARENRERIELRIREAERLLSFTHDSNEYSLMTIPGQTRSRLLEQYDAMLALAERTSGQYRAAYLTNAVSYARVLGLEGPVHGALERAANDPEITRTIRALTRKLGTPLGVDHRER